MRLSRGLIGFLSAGLISCSCTERSPLSIAWVSTDRMAFESEKGETVFVRYRLSAPASVTLRFMDPYGEPVRTLVEKSEAGDRRFVWDGRDDAGRLVPPEAYTYTLSASAEAWFGPAREVTYDPARGGGGEPVRVRSVEWDAETGRVSYVVSKPSRVRLILGRFETGWPLGVVLDWAPRGAGRHTESLSDWNPDGVVEVRGLGGVVPALQAFSLPENSVILAGDEKESENGSIGKPTAQVPYRWSGAGAQVYPHAAHPRSRCYSPKVEMSFPEAEMVDGVVQLRTATPLRVEVTSEGSSHRLGLPPRPAVFIFVDEELREKDEDGYLPYQWVMEPEELGRGEHLVSVYLSWPEDHFGVGHVRVRVTP